MNFHFWKHLDGKAQWFYFKINAFFCTPTYLGYDGQFPIRNKNQEITWRAEHRVQKLWGNHRVYVVYPKVEPIDVEALGFADKFWPNAERMPEYQCTAWIVIDGDACQPAIEKKSQAFLIWYQSKQDTLNSIDAQLQNLFMRNNLKWEDISEEIERPL